MDLHIIVHYFRVLFKVTLRQCASIVSGVLTGPYAILCGDRHAHSRYECTYTHDIYRLRA